MGNTPAGAGPAPREDLLVAMQVDLAGDPPAEDVAQRLANALLLGKAGDVRMARAGAAAWATRAFGRLRPGARPQVRRAQPDARADDSVVLLAGRIHHREKTCRSLGLDPGFSHAQLYRALYDRHGDACDGLIAGDYAVVQWFPGPRRLRLARSPLSQYPLHVWELGDRIAVASIARALFAIGAPAQLDEAKVGDMMMLNLRDQRRGWYRDLRLVEAGTYEIHERGRADVTRFWSVETVKPVRFARDEDYLEAVREQFAAAAEAYLEDVRRPGVWLSGGLDSQGLASFLLDELPAERRLDAFTYVPMPGPVHAPEGMFHDERDHVAAFAAMHPRISPHYVDGSGHAYGDRLDSIFLLGSVPTHNEMAAHWGHEGYARAYDLGCDVMFSATGGNAGFSYDGMTGYPTWLRQGRFGHLLRELRRSDMPRPLWWKALSLAVWPNLPKAGRIWADKRLGRHEAPFESWNPLREEFARTSGAIDRALATGHDVTTQREASSMHWRADVLSCWGADMGDLQTAFTLLHGVQDRDPTTYRPLLDLCIGIPDEQYLRNGETRWIARRLLRGRVPEMVRTERRRGYQSTDWPARFERDRANLLAELDTLATDATLARMFDFERMAGSLRAWSPDPEANGAYRAQVQLAIGRGVATARFVRYVQGSNAG